MLRDESPLRTKPWAAVGSFRYIVREDRWEWSDEVARMHGYRPGSITPTTDLVLDAPMNWFGFCGCDSLSWPQRDDLKWLHCAVAGVLKGRLDLAPSLRHAASVMTT